jgi:flagellar protein FliS
MNAFRAQVNQTYHRAQVETASPEKLLLMLYDGAIRKLVQARHHFDRREEHEFQTQVVKVQKIISELMVTLDHDKGGDVANNLSRIYEYMLRQLALAVVRRDPELLVEVKSLLQELRSGWQAAIEQQMESAEGQTAVSAPLPPPVELQRPAMAGINIEG